MFNYKISVVVPVYNVQDYIKECIDSIVNQTYSNLEIILVDDGSTDMSGKICDKYAENDSRIKVIHKENGGLVSARKAGVDVATGDYIAFVDADDWIDLDCYEVILSRFSGYEPDLVAFGNKKTHDKNVIERYELIDEGYYTNKEIYSLIDNYYGDNNIALNHIILVNVWNKLFKPNLLRSCLSKVDNRIVNGEDMALVIPYFLVAISLYIVHYAPYNYRIRSNSIVHTDIHKNTLSSKLVIKRLQESTKENSIIKNESIYKLFLSYCYFTALLSNICYFINSPENLYPELKQSKSIIIYGRGVYGNNLTELIKKDGKHSIVGMVDKLSVQMITNYDFDYVIIAITNGTFVIDAINCLKQEGVPENKILYLKNKDLSENLLKDIFMQ